MDALDSIRGNLTEKDRAEQREVVVSPFAPSSTRSVLPLTLKLKV